MKYRMVLKANREDVFGAFVENFQNEYLAETGKWLPEKKIVKGFSFEKTVGNSRNVRHRASVKVLEFEKPSLYRVRYTSDRYRKITGLWLNQLSDGNLEIITEEILDRVHVDKNGEVSYVSEIAEDEKIRPASLWKKFQYRYLIRSIRLKKEEKVKCKR